MRDATLWRTVLNLESAVVEYVEFDEAEELLVAHMRCTRGARHRCGHCSRRCRRYDGGEGRRRWRTLDVGCIKTYLEADSPRVRCPEHGVTVAQVPWARHRAGHTYTFDEQLAWLATTTSKAAACELMRIAWRTVGAIVTRVWEDVERRHDRFAGLRRIGIDEISYKRGYRFLTIVVDHDSGRLVWAAPGRDRATLSSFFDALEASGPGRCAQITHVSADGAQWIAKVVANKCPNAVLCADAFHVVKWATKALDTVRRQAWNHARKAGNTRANGRGRRDAKGEARALKSSRYALWKNPENLTERQHTKLAWIATSNPQVYRAYLLKEGLRVVFKLDYEDACTALQKWVQWARRCRIPAFVDLQRQIVRYKDTILAAIEHGLSNGRIESVNTKIRLITRVAFGFRSPQALIALAMLHLGGHRPALPGRT